MGKYRHLPLTNQYINQLAVQFKNIHKPWYAPLWKTSRQWIWCGDSSVGPYLKTDDGKKHQVYIITLIDDASRLIVGIDVFFHGNFCKSYVGH